MRILSLFRPALVAAAMLPATPVLANPALVFDPSSGQVIQQEDIFRRWHPASLTKLMTAYVTFKALKDGEMALNSPIKISKKATRQQPSKMGYPVGSVMTANNALTMLLVKSANDIAMAIAENVGGSEQAFVARMNAEAKRLGMTDTNYVNPHGLNADAQFTSARDMGILVSALRRDFPERMGYFSIEGIVAGKKTFENFNAMIGRYPGADGMKTGYICSSGYNIITSSTRNGRTLVAVVFGEKSVTSRADKAAQLLDQGFAAPAQGSALLTNLERPASRVEGPMDMRPIMCPKPVPGQKPVEEGAENAKADVPSRWQMPLDHAPTFVQVGLGGANGPVPAGKLDAGGQEFADVPLPGWRPDMPDPTVPGSQAAAEPQQGDTAVATELRP